MELASARLNNTGCCDQWLTGSTSLSQRSGVMMQVRGPRAKRPRRKHSRHCVALWTAVRSLHRHRQHCPNSYNLNVCSNVQTVLFNFKGKGISLLLSCHSFRQKSFVPLFLLCEWQSLSFVPSCQYFYTKHSKSQLTHKYVCALIHPCFNKEVLLPYCHKRCSSGHWSSTERPSLQRINRGSPTWRSVGSTQWRSEGLRCYSNSRMLPLPFPCCYGEFLLGSHGCCCALITSQVSIALSSDSSYLWRLRHLRIISVDA